MTMEVIGPYATQLMADLGADVVKVEPPQGDGRRTQGPSRHPKMTSQFLHNNRGKRSIVVDLKRPQGRAVVLRLCEEADVFVYNSRRAAMQRLGLTCEDVSAANPRIVYCGAAGFGEGGPYASKPAYDEVIQGLSAIPMLQARLNGAAPSFLPFMFADRSCGLMLAHTLLAALLARDRLGTGQAIELPMFETLAAFVLSEHMEGRGFEPALGEAGMDSMFARRPARTLDGYLCYAFERDDQFAAFCDLVGRPEMMSDARFARGAERDRNMAQCHCFVESELAGRTTAEWLARFDRAGLPAAPVRSLEQLMDDPQLRQAGFFKPVEHPTEGPLVMMRVPTRWSDTEPENTRPAPLLGEHTIEVLREAGYAGADIQALLADGAVRAAPAKQTA
ncbi:CoA transferase [Pigmentiphaga soli]|uniref:CoA transferase n=2 Tax=Pigmentiphaga soli TaxID=1007095 RepID=A0ABP8HRX6_9BURK